MNEAPEVLAIVGATVIDGNGGAPIKDGVVIVEGQRIVAVGDRSTQIPPQGKKISATGKFVIPGLMCQAYLADGTFLTTLIRYEGRFDEVAIEAAQLQLKGGLTTVFDAWGPRDALIKARDAINQGRVTGARICLAGNIVGYGGPLSADFRAQFRTAIPKVFADRIDAQWQLNVGQALARMTPDQVREELRKYVHSGIDFVHCAVTDHREGALQYLVFSPRVLQLIVEEAHRAGLPVAAMSPWSNEGLVQASNAGVDLTTITPQLSCISDETVALIGKRQTPCAMTCNTAKLREWYLQHEKSIPGYRGYGTVDATIRRLLDAGAVPLLLSSGGVISEDESNSWKDHESPPIKGLHVVGEGHVHQLQAMQENGVTPMGALMAATRNIARAFKIDKDLGTLERGKIADLLILDKNPLDNTQHYLSIHLVMKEGKVVDRDSLPTQRLITAPPPG